MFRLFFVLALAFLLSCFAKSQNKSANQSHVTATKSNCCAPQAGYCKDGKDGKDGQNGKDGRDGINGRDGRDGTVGAKGETGSAGQKGQKGEKGQKGMPGTCGDKSSSSSSRKRDCCKFECSTGFHFFEKVQDLPTKGAAAVQHFTINGSLFLAFGNYRGDIHKHKTSSMIYKMDEPTEKFTLYQTLRTRGAYGVEYFSIADKHFLAVASHYDGTHQLDSEVFRWNGQRFLVFQKLSTKGAGHFEFFTLNSEKYLTVANYHDGTTNLTKSVIYKWNGVKFIKFQEIATEGARGCTAFEINSNTFIAFANFYDPQLKFSVQSTVFKWSGGHFVKLQSLQTYGAYDVKSVHINGHTFLAFACQYSGSSFNTDSFIYKWDGTKFVLFQSIPTRGALAWNSFVICGSTYLGVANYYDSSQKHNTQSTVYQASGAQFVKYQEISTHGAHDMTSFEYKGHTYLAVANYYNQKNNINSALYKWV